MHVTRYCIFFNMLFFSSIIVPITHVIGDSHAAMYGGHGLNTYTLSGTTMHRVGRDNLGLAYISSFNINDEDVVIFVFGEVDVRCHIGRIRDIKNRTLEDVIEDLTDRYIATIIEMKKNRNVRAIISGVVPPSNAHYNPDFPFYGTLTDRVTIVRKLNEALYVKAIAMGLFFIDAYTPFCVGDGSMNVRLGDGIHISSKHNRHMMDQLHRILNS